MLKSEVKCENLTRNNIIYRATLRGLKKCTSCGYITGQRALVCRNVNCVLRIKRLAAIKPFDPIQLVTYGQTKLYSLRSKEKLLQPRIFVSITETRGIMESRLCAVCYVDNCKYDAFEPTHFVCRHIMACKELTNAAVADVYPIDKSILWNLNIPLEQKQHLWDLYQLEEKLIHPIQKLNSSVFVVKCLESKIFPAGRLHVTVFSNKMSHKSGNFSCSCKKLKLMLEADNSVVMKQEICDHLLLLLSAILNKPEGKTLYGKFLDLLQHLWMPTYLNTPIVDCATKPTQFMNYDVSLGTCNKQNIKVENTEICDSSEDLFNFTEDLFAENNIPDFSDIILDVNNDEVSNIPKLSTPKQEVDLKDPKLNAATTVINDDEMVLNFPHIHSPQYLTCLDEINTQASTLFSENGLSVIEQFQLNNNIQVSNDNIELAKDIETLNNLGVAVLPPCTARQTSLLKTSRNDNIAVGLTTNTNIITKPKKSLTTFPVQKSVVLKQGPVKIIKIANPVKKLPAEKFSKIIQISKIDPNKTIVRKTKQYVGTTKQIVNNCNVIPPTFLQQNRLVNVQINSVAIPSLSYESWLDYIIEYLHEKITIHNSSVIESSFHVPVAIFNHFSKTFTLNTKTRLPNKTNVIENEKYKDQIKYTWYFNQSSTVQRIFKTKNMMIELDRSYQRLADGSYELYAPTTTTNPIANNNFRTIYPKVQLYKVFVQFNDTELCSKTFQPHKCGFKLDWLPSAFPKSNFGLMTIQFSLSVKQPDGIM